MNKGRLEAFSDGVIAIIITVMVFDLKSPEITNVQNLWVELLPLLPKVLFYSISFVTLAVMWINHHAIFDRLKHTDPALIWLNILLLFLMSFIPFATNFIGANHELPEASLLYGLIMTLNSFAFYLLRRYVGAHGLLLHEVSEKTKLRYNFKNMVGVSIYLMASFVGYISVYLSFALFLAVPLMYFIPDKTE